MFRIKNLSIIVLTLICFTFSASAQTGGVVSGTIKDTNDASVSGANVSLTNRDASVVLNATTDAGGVYRFERVPAGEYVLEATANGFQKVTQTTRLDAGGNTTLDLNFAVSSITAQVVVTASGTTQTIEEVSKAVSVVDATEIQNRNEYFIPEALRTAPGIQVRNGGGPGQFTSVRSRGLRPDATAFLVDGLRFRDASTTQGDASSFGSNLNILNADRLEFVRGSGSSLYGTNAVGGVVNIVTDQGGGRPRGTVQLEGGALGLVRGTGKIGGGAFADRLKYSFGGMHLNVTKGVDGNDATRSTGGQGFLRYDFTTKISLTGRIYASDDFVQLNASPTTTGIPAANFPATGIIRAIALAPDQVTRTLTPGNPINFGSATFIPGRDDPDNRRSSNFYTPAVIFNYNVNEYAAFRASYQRTHTDRTFENERGGVGFQPAALSFGNYVGDIDTFEVRGNFQLGRNNLLTAGYEFEREAYFDAQDNNLPTTRRVVTATRIKQNANAVFIQNQLSLFRKRLQLAVSGRIQSFKLERPELTFTGLTNPYANTAIAATPTAKTIDASLSYFIEQTKTKLRAHGGNAYRAPALYERFGGGFSANQVTGVVAFTPYGDPRLSPDLYNSFDAGVDQTLADGRVLLSSTFFYTRVKQLTGFRSFNAQEQASDPFRRTSGYVNAAGGYSRGAEFEVRAQPIRTLNLTSSYTYTNADQDQPVITGSNFYRVLNVAANMFTLTANQQIGRRVNVTFDMYRSGRYYLSYFAGSGNRPFEFPGYTKADLGASYRLPLDDRRGIRFFGQVENIFNQRYYEGGWLAARAGFRGGAAFDF